MSDDPLEPYRLDGSTISAGCLGCPLRTPCGGYFRNGDAWSCMDHCEACDPTTCDRVCLKNSSFIQDLADGQGRSGYDAHLGERGVKLSGGQRQRIALARAILKDAPILVLDEATSALDSEVEAAIQTALERVMDGKTVLAIAHRLSTLSEMDRIIVMEQGEMVETGSHDELLALGGRYAQFWARQSGGFIGTDDDEATQAAQ